MQFDLRKYIMFIEFDNDKLLYDENPPQYVVRTVKQKDFTFSNVLLYYTVYIYINIIKQILSRNFLFTSFNDSFNFVMVNNYYNLNN